MGSLVRFVAPLVLVAGIAPVAASAQVDSSALSGDWGGVRTRLLQDGISLHADYVSETFTVADGGRRRGTAYTDQIRFGADFDMGRMAGWTGTTLHLTFNDRSGKGLSSSYISNRLPVQEAYGGQYLKLTELSVEQSMDNGRLDLRAGFFAMGNDTGGMALGCNLVNAAFCAHPLSLSGDSGWYNYPNARWGFAVRYRLRPDLIVRTGLYQVNAALSTQKNAFNPWARGTTGTLIPLELEYDPGSQSLPGHYKIGLYRDASRVAREAAAGTVKGRSGLYLLADQTLVRQGNRGLAIFGQWTINPQGTAQITRWAAAGLVKTGTFSQRDQDTIALGLVFAKLNPRLRQANPEPVADGGYVPPPAGETVVELSYGYQIRPGLSLRPDVQYIIDPGAFTYRPIANALAFGAQVKAQF
jgi:porin